MIVSIYDYDAAGNEEGFRGQCDFDEAMWPREDDPEAYDAARDELRQNGRVWIGGGAAPLVLLTLDRLADECHGYDLNGDPIG